jgi:hypothetical protein
LWLIVKGFSPAARAALCLLAGHLFVGLAHLAVLPPWEGFDEIAHYSSIQQLADRREIPRLYQARVSTDVERYSRLAPFPYSLEGLGGITYENFFARSGEELARANEFIHGRPDEPRRYAPGGQFNWEAQHPPLYYLALVPVYAATRQMSWAMQLLTLRVASYALAWTALLLGVCACLRAVPSTASGTDAKWEWAAIGIGLWPLLLPSWFADMARIGNDSMCALLLAGVWWLTIHAGDGAPSLGRALALGALLGAGCLTKVFFVPVTLACLGFWSVRAWALGRPRGLASNISRMAALLLVAGIVGGWWYFWNWREHGVPFADLEWSELRRSGGLLSGLARNASLLRLLKAPADLGVTLVWPGTWSLVGAPLVSLAPVGLTVMLAGGAYWAALRRLRASAVAWLPAWLVGLMLLGLGWQTLVRMAVSGKGQPAHYLHVLAPALGAAVGMGLGTGWRSGAFRKVFAGGLAYVLCFGAGIFWAQIMLFSGLVVWYGADHIRAYSARAVFHGLFEVPEALARLTMLAYPRAGVAAWLVGNAFVLAGLGLAWKTARDLERRAALLRTAEG